MRRAAPAFVAARERSILILVASKIELDKSAFAYYDSEMKYIVEAGEFDILIGNSSRDEDLKSSSFVVEETIYID